MAGVFPELSGVKMEYAWGGRIALALHAMPLVGRRRDGLWVCTGFGGEGIVASALGAAVVAEGICGETDRYSEPHMSSITVAVPLYVVPLTREGSARALASMTFNVTGHWVGGVGGRHGGGSGGGGNGGGGGGDRGGGGGGGVTPHSWSLLAHTP
jgi:hypothetical protein